MNTKNIMQFSPQRSGSTLIFNMLRDVFPDSKVFKMHQLPKVFVDVPIVCTYRFPLDCIASSLEIDNLSPKDEIIQSRVNDFRFSFGNRLRLIRNRSNVLMLKYEDFVDDFEIIYSAFESFFGIDLPQDQRASLSAKYNIEAIKKQTAGMEKFSEYDKITHWHGNHISKYNGKSSYYESIFTPKQIAYLKDVYQDFISEFGYLD